PQSNDQSEKVAAAVKTLRPIVEAAAAQGCSIGLYNHGGWFGDPENQLAIIAALDAPNVGIVYNLHHGHDHLDRLPLLLEKMKPHLYAVTLNGTDRDGERRGRKILPIGQGELDLELLRTIQESGYDGPLAILGHTHEDVELRLKDNLDGLAWLTNQLNGRPPDKRPTPRTPVPSTSSAR
ncbi:MAG: sugar phosphate isomerase/epimerase, partial [Pirellulales bacterium]|nr:sugar phosphate isomerase/epimerase [Pirellulales bacterium]